jgi:protein-tyrosine phosphatase
MEDLLVRPATEEDADSIAAILTEATALKVSLGDYSWDEGVWSAEEVKGMMKAEQMFVALLGGVAVGCFSLTWQDTEKWGTRPDDAGYLHKLALTSNVRGQGLGPKLVDLAASEVERQGRQYLRLDCDQANPNLCHYYEKQGFDKVGTAEQKPNGYVPVLYERPV